jgi:hypothetical protein
VLTSRKSRLVIWSRFSWENAPVKHHDTGVLLASVVTVAISTARDRTGR